jgi:hypothetical protein
MAGCGGADKKAEVADKKAPEPVAFFHVDPGTAGALHGTVTYHGPKPARTRLSTESDPGCAKATKGKSVYDDSVVLSGDGGVANVFVYIKTGLEGKKFETPTEPAVLDQSGCTFGPRVFGVQIMQPVMIRNSDPVEHSVHPTPQNNASWNDSMSPGAPDMKRRFAHPEVMVRVKCNIHSWMRSYIGVLAHPYFAVTGPDGSFDLKNVPPGNYTVAIWHEKLGEMEQPVTLAASGSQTLGFTLAATKQP